MTVTVIGQAEAVIKDAISNMQRQDQAWFNHLKITQKDQNFWVVF